VQVTTGSFLARPRTHTAGHQPTVLTGSFPAARLVGAPVESIQSMWCLVENALVHVVCCGCGRTATIRNADKRSLGWMTKTTSASS
jgi:hypothetical protein